MDIHEIYKLFNAYPKICTDTRKIEKDSIFFALKGENFNGNSFALKAIEQGSVYAVVDEELHVASEKLIQVDNVLITLQKLARFHRDQLKIPVIAITGTNGKTTTKELIREVLSKQFNTVATEGNLNNHIGVPLTLLKIHDKHEAAVIEMGANHQGEIKALCEIANPSHGLITNIGKAHLEGFGGPQGVIKAKNELYIYLRENKRIAFVNADNQLLMDLSEGIERVTYGLKQEAMIVGDILESSPYVSFQWKLNKEDFFEDHQIESKIPGLYNLENLLAAVCIGHYFDVYPFEIKEAIENYVPTLNRSQIIKKGNNTILLDAYNANPTSMEAAVTNFISMEGKNKVLILGEMLELGDLAKAEHNALINLLKIKGIENAFLIGKSFVDLHVNSDYHIFPDTAVASDYLKTHPFHDSFLLIKGSRGNKLEQLLEVL